MLSLHLIQDIRIMRTKMLLLATAFFVFGRLGDSAAQVANDVAQDHSQPSNQIALVKDHNPINYSGYLLYFVEGDLVGSDVLTQTWSIVPREEAEFEHAFRIETHAIHTDADKGHQPSFVGETLFEEQFENTVRYELFHQTEDRSLVLDAVQVNDKPLKIESREQHLLYPGRMEIGTQWISQSVTQSQPETRRHEVTGWESYKGTKCWVVSCIQKNKANPLVKNSETITKSSRFLFDPLTLSVLRIDTVIEGLGPLGKEFKFVYHMEVAK
jgi:hypothetical protein